MSRLVVVSNRIAPPDEHAASAGGLAVGILGALKAAGGLWFGWSGETGNEDRSLITFSRTPTKKTITRIHQYLASQSMLISSCRTTHQATSCSMIR